MATEQTYAGLPVNRRHVVCGGGASVLGVMIASLLGGAKPVRAQSILGAVPEVDALAVRVVTDSYQFAVAPSRKTDMVEIQHFGWGLSANRPPERTLISEFGLLMPANVIATIIGALDQAYGLREGRSWINRHLTALVLSVGSAVVAALILAATVSGPLLGHGVSLATRLGYTGAAATVREWLRLPIAFALVILWTTTLYHLAPNRRAPWRRDLPGAVLFLSSDDAAFITGQTIVIDGGWLASGT